MPSADPCRQPTDETSRERIQRAAQTVYSSLRPATDGTITDDDQLLQQRIAAFYRQSGGPASPQIESFLDHHLRYGADHGEPGHKETIEDVFQQVVEGDQSLKTMLKLWSRRQGRREQEQEEERERKADLTTAIVRLEGHIGELTKAIQQLLADRAGSAEQPKEWPSPTRRAAARTTEDHE